MPLETAPTALPGTVPKGVPLAQCTPAALREQVRTQGYAAAVEMLHQALLADPLQGAFIREIDGSPGGGPRFPLAIVPGALYKEYRDTGGDGKRFVEIVGALGYECTIIPVQSVGRLRENGRIVTQWLAARREPVTLVSFSKGSADVKAALAEPENHAAFARVRGWLSVGGIMHGTPLVAWLKRRRLRMAAIRLWCWWRGEDVRMLDDMAHGPGTPLDGPLCLPEGLKLVHLVALPGERDLSMPLARRAFARLLAEGPNDAGGLLLGDVSRFPGMVYPLCGADHYLRDLPALPGLLATLISWAAG